MMIRFIMNDGIGNEYEIPYRSLVALAKRANYNETWEYIYYLKHIGAMRTEYHFEKEG